MKVGLIQRPKPGNPRPGKRGRNTPLPNIALMRLSSWHKALGDTVVLNPDPTDDCGLVYISTMFTWQRREIEELAAHFRPHSDVVIGGSGWDYTVRLPAEVDAMPNDYDLAWPTLEDGRLVWKPIDYGIGYTSRGCVRRCGFCLIGLGAEGPRGHIWETSAIGSLLNSRSNKLMLLDNSFGGSPAWREKMAEIERRGLIVDWPQGLDIRLLDEEQAAALGRLRARGQIRGDRFTAEHALHFAWDQPVTETSRREVERGLQLLFSVGFKPHDLTLYVLAGFKSSLDDELLRCQILHAQNIQPYVMVFRAFGDATPIDPERARLKQWNNGHAWRNTPFSEYRPSLTHGRAAELRDALPLPIDV